MARKRKSDGTFAALVIGLALGLGAWVALDGLDVVRARIFPAAGSGEQTEIFPEFSCLNDADCGTDHECFARVCLPTFGDGK